MGCLKLKYHTDLEALEAKAKNFLHVVGKEKYSPKNRVNFYPYGAIMPGRNSALQANTPSYQGQLKDAETNWSAFKLRMYDGRLARWHSADPFAQHWSPYVSMGNNPIRRIDPDGGTDYYIDGLKVSGSIYNKFMDKNGYNIDRLDFGGDAFAFGDVIGVTYDGNSYYGNDAGKRAAKDKKRNLELHWERELGIKKHDDAFYKTVNKAYATKDGKKIAGGVFTTLLFDEKDVDKQIENIEISNSQNYSPFSLSNPISLYSEDNYQQSGIVGDFFTSFEKHFNGNLGLTGAAVDGFNKIPKKVKRKFAYKLSKITKYKAGAIYQNLQKFAKTSGKVTSKLGVVGSALTVGVITYEVSSDTWDAHTIINGTLLATTAVATVFAAPAVLVGIAAYGIGDYFFDFSGKIDSAIGRKSEIWKDN